MQRIILIGLLAAVMSGSLASAEPAQGFRDFSAKRIKAPTGPLGKRITVQIDPVEQAKLLAVLPKPSIPAVVVTPDAGADAGGALGRYAWFWDKVSPGTAGAGAGRLETAMNVLSGASQQIPGPRMQHMQGIAKTNGVDILMATVGTQVSPALVLAVIAVESAGRSDAVSSAGAQGLMQLMPATAARFGVMDSFKATQNIQGGVKYLDWLMQEFNGDPMLVLAGYNAGEGNVRTHSGVPPFAETRDYVPKVLAAFQVARGLCRTPPELISDGCVFVAMN